MSVKRLTARPIFPGACWLVDQTELIDYWTILTNLFPGELVSLWRTILYLRAVYTGFFSWNCSKSFINFVQNNNFLMSFFWGGGVREFLNFWWVFGLGLWWGSWKDQSFIMIDIHRTTERTKKCITIILVSWIFTWSSTSTFFLQEKHLWSLVVS